MLLENERLLVLKYSQKMVNDKLITGTGGNISILNSELGLIAITPSSIDYLSMSVADIVVVDMDGKLIDGKHKPSSELFLHQIMYKNRPNIKSVVHTHSVYACILASQNLDLPAINYYIGITNDTEVRCAPYAKFGSDQLAKNAYETMQDSYACLLANHGLVTCEKNIDKAYEIAIECERMANIYYHCLLLGKPNILNNEEALDMVEAFKDYKQ